MRTLKSVGLITPPCGVPFSSVTYADAWPWNITRAFRPVKYCLTHDSSFPYTPSLVSSPRMTSGWTLSKALFNVYKNSCLCLVVCSVVGQAVCSTSVLHKAIYTCIEMSNLIKETVEEDPLKDFAVCWSEADGSVFVFFSLWNRYNICHGSCFRQHTLCE